MPSHASAATSNWCSTIINDIVAKQILLLRDIEQTKRMVDRFLAEGFIYFDTAWAYPGSEDAIREALVERYPREKFQLATKNAAWLECRTREDAAAQFETSLRQTGAGYIDFYLLHNLGEGRTHFFDDFDMWRFVQEKKKEGLIRHVGFSFHSTPEELEEILKAHPEMKFMYAHLWPGAEDEVRDAVRSFYDISDQKSNYEIGRASCRERV